MRKVAVTKKELCFNCGFCRQALACVNNPCTGCGACIDACPGRARQLEALPGKEEMVEVIVDGRPYQLPASITILEALKQIGYVVSRIPGEGHISAPCRTGGCWNCAVLVNGELKPSCITPVTRGEITTSPAAIIKKPPVRLVSGFIRHLVGGVGTPHWLKPKRASSSSSFIEIACFTNGCNLRCPSCQNWEVTYASRGALKTSEQAALTLTTLREEFDLNRITVSGGESTLNRRWLLELLRALRRLNPPAVRLHVDTNTTTLTPDYIDELVTAGMTDIGVDLKATQVDTFMSISGIADVQLAGELMNRAWNAVEYLLRRYHQKIFIGVGIPYNPSLVTSEEILAAGRRLAVMNPSVQVCLLDYRPEFRRLDISEVAPGIMIALSSLLKKSGLECIICQTSEGHYGPF